MKRYSSLFLGGAAALLLTACPETTTGDGGINVNVDVAGLLSGQSFCMTWDLYQSQGESWDLIDAREDPLCGAPGAERLSDFATCYDGQRFLVRYDIVFYGPDGEVIGDAEATSGGGPEDLCVKNTDTDSWALVQFKNEGNAGGVNPGVEVDQVCANDKIECETPEGDISPQCACEEGQIVSALWLQPDDCLSGTPDDFCALGFGAGLATVRTGVTLDGLTRYIFSTSTPEDFWSAFYLAFEPELEEGVLHLYNSPWVLGHFLMDGYGFGRYEFDEVLGSFRIDNPEGGISVGFLYRLGGQIFVVYDHSGSCNSDVELDAKLQVLHIPRCAGGLATELGVIATGGSTFEVIYECEGEIIELPCDANGINGGICEAELCGAGDARSFCEEK